jgi:tubulin-specific chaperone B
MDSRCLPHYLLSSLQLIYVLHMGDRCEVEPGAKRGTVKFVGHVEALGRGFWVGVQYD